jgi:hypothetical protein
MLEAPVPTHSLEGLIKWLRHDEWRAPFENTLAEHLKPACDEAGITPDEIASVLGEDFFTMLWGCAFEDFLSRDLEGGRNFVEDYLKRRGWKGNYSPPHLNVFMQLNQQLTPISSRCRVESNCGRVTSRAASREAVLVASSGTLLA